MTLPQSGAVPAPPEYALVRVLAEAATVEDATHQLLATIAESFGWVVGALWLVDERGELLRHAEDWGLDEPEITHFREVSRSLTFGPEIGLPGRVWSTGEPAWITDVAEDLNFPRVDAARRAGLRAAAALPVLGPDRVLGVIEFFLRDARGPDARQVELMRTAGRQMGQYLARKRVEERLRATEEISASIVNAALDCIISMDHKGMIVDFNPAAEEVFGYRRADVMGRRLAELIVPPELRQAHEQAIERYLRTGRGRILNRRLELEAMRADGTRLPVELTVTRVGRGNPPLFAGFVRDITDRRRSREEVARLLEREHAARLRAEEAERSARKVSEVLQRSLLPPHLPEVPGVELGAVYRAGAEGSLVGGDFYDVFQIDAGRWGIAVGDVRGKGAEAASLTALVRYSIRTAAVRERRPSAVLEVLNGALMRDTGVSEFCTAVYACLSLDNGRPRLVLSVGGHPLPLLVSEADGVTTAGEPGTLLGAVPDPELHDFEVTLDRRDLVLFYTDGVTESRTPDGFFGIERLRALLGGVIGLDAASVVRRVEEAVVDVPGHHAADDVAVLAVQAS